MNTNDIDIFRRSARDNGTPNPLSRVEALRPLIRSALMKDELSEHDRTILTRKAVTLGFDAEEFGLLLDAMVTSKKQGGKNPCSENPTTQTISNLNSTTISTKHS